MSLGVEPKTHTGRGLLGLVVQVVVTYMSPVEAFNLWPGSRFLLSKKCAWSLDHPFYSSWSLDFFYRSKVELEPRVLDLLIFTVQNLTWSLDQLSKRALIAGFNFDPGHKHFYTEHMCLCSPCGCPVVVVGIVWWLLWGWLLWGLSGGCYGGGCCGGCLVVVVEVGGCLVVVVGVVQ